MIPKSCSAKTADSTPKKYCTQCHVLKIKNAKNMSANEKHKTIHALF